MSDAAATGAPRFGILRGLAERLGRDFRFTTRLPARFGRRRMRVSPANQLSILKPGDAKFQPYLLDYADRFVTADSVVWDIGANMGMFALPAAHRGAQTFAFEPEAFNVHLLNTTAGMNPDLRLEIVPVGLADKVDLARFAVAERGRSASQLDGIAVGTQAGGVRQHTVVVTVSADWLLDRYPAPDVVKCDAEGAETLILQGATRVLAEARPIVLLEVGHENGVACTEIFHANDYLIVTSARPITRETIVSEIGDNWEIIAIPREKFDAYLGK